MPDAELDTLTSNIEAFRLEASRPGNHVSWNLPVQLCEAGNPKPRMTAREEAEFVLRFRAEVAAKQQQDKSG